MTATIDAARQVQRPHPVTVHVCKACTKTLSVAEFIERHCEACGKDVDIVATRERP